MPSYRSRGNETTFVCERTLGSLRSKFSFPLVCALLLFLLLTRIPDQTSNLQTMLANRRVQGRSKDDVLERFFEWSENAFCPHTITKGELPTEEDVLDYVFEHVESFSCVDDVERLPNGQPRTVERDNSLIEGYLALASPRGIQIQPFGQQGDMLDVCFEQIEAYACKEGEESPCRQKSNRFNLGRQIRRSVGASGIHRKFEEAYAELEAQNEMQLYFRPNHSTRN